jgi:mono/diheme cytochrome c family protein
VLYVKEEAYMKGLWILFVTAIVLVAGFLSVIYSGLYNVAATQPHTAFVEWMLRTLTQRSIESRARNISVPALDRPGLLDMGFDHYHEMCVGCHGAPGVKPEELAEGLYPEPPDLTTKGGIPPPGRIFWVVKNGIKMTGMPAFGPTHTDEQIWAITAFVRQLPEMTPEHYRQMADQAGNSTDEHHEHEKNP